MLPQVGQDGLIIKDAAGRRMRIKVEYLDDDEKVEAPRLSLPVAAVQPAPPVEKPLQLVDAQPTIALSKSIDSVNDATNLLVVKAPVPTLMVETEGSKPKIAPPAPVKIVYDHPRIGGRFTVFSLLYGDYFDMHKRHLDAILKTCPPERIDFRVGSNQLGQRSLDYVQSLGREGLIHLHYYHKGNHKKYPVMREMFWDDQNPINTQWIIWFDDDSMCDRNQDWLTLLAQQIVNYPDIDMFGPVRFYRLTENQPQWIRQAPWYRGRSFRDKSGKPVPNGDKVHFVVGAFWALRTEAMRAADIPCRRLQHNGGDWTIGEQLYQAGFKIKNWSGNKEIVEWSALPRRGLSEVHPGTRNRIQ